MRPLVTQQIDVDVTAVAPAGVGTCAVEVFAPPDPARDAAVAFCLPGGWYSRAYFDLRPPAALGGYSMARHLAAAGLVVVTCDPPGIGGSDAPDDPYSLTPTALADVQAAVTLAVLDGLQAGTLVSGLDAVPGARAVGVGHSAGALLTVHEQARHRPFRGLALLGFAGRGLAAVLTDDERGYADDPEGARVALPRLVEARFGTGLAPFPRQTTSIFSGNAAPPPVKDALRGAQDRLLTLLGLTSMIPGASAGELAAIDVPVFVGVGDADITGDPHAIPGDLPNATDVTLFVLADSGHAHNIAPTRAVLWDRLTRWVEDLA